MENCYLQCRYSVQQDHHSFTGYFIKVDDELLYDDFGGSDFPSIQLPPDWAGDRIYLRWDEDEETSCQFLSPCSKQEAEEADNPALVQWIEAFPEVPIRAIRGSVYSCLFVDTGLCSSALFVYDGRLLDGYDLNGDPVRIDVGLDWDGRAHLLRKCETDGHLVPAEVTSTEAFWRIGLVTAANNFTSENPCGR